MAKKTAAPVTPAPVVTPTEKPSLTPEQIVLGATNDPAISKDTFKLGDKTYKYVHLSYDYYIEFMLKIKPLLAVVVGTVAAKAKATVTLPGIQLIENPMQGVLQFAGEDIPDMIRIIVNNSLEAENSTDKITVPQIKALRGITPMSLSGIVMGQVTYNNMITDFASFFVQMLPLLNQMGIVKQQDPKTNPVK